MTVWNLRAETLWQPETGGPTI